MLAAKFPVNAEVAKAIEATKSTSTTSWEITLNLLSPRDSNTPISYFLSLRDNAIIRTKIIAPAMDTVATKVFEKDPTFSIGPTICVYNWSLASNV